MGRLIVARAVIVALVLGCAGASSAAEPARAGAESLTGYEAEAAGAEDQIGARIAPEGLIAAWLGVFAALTALYAHERRHQLVGRERLAHHALALRRVAPFAIAGLTAKRWSEAARRGRVSLLRPRGAASSPHAQNAPRAVEESGSTEPKPVAAPEEAPAHRVGFGLGATQAGEETFRVADGDDLGRAPVEAAAQAVAPSPAPPAPEPVAAVVPDAAQLSLDLSTKPSEADAAQLSLDLDAQPGEAPAPLPAAPAPAVPDPTPPTPSQHALLEPATEPPDFVRRCAALRALGQFADAAHLAREGLAGAGDPGPLLVELSRAELGLGRVNAAIDIARDAHFASRSRESVMHLIRILTETRRFAREDGPALRRAASRHPRQPLLLYAAGVFESMHGKAGDAEKWLRAALPLAPDAETRRAIAGELARVEESRARTAS